MSVLVLEACFTILLVCDAAGLSGRRLLCCRGSTGHYAGDYGGSMSKTPSIWSKTTSIWHYHGRSCRGHVAAPDEGTALRPDRTIRAFRSRIPRRQGHLPDCDARLVFSWCG